MKILAIEQELPGKIAEDFRPYLKPEAARVWGLVQQGVFREVYFRADNHCAVILLECDSIEAACAELDTLPLVKAGLVNFEVIPLEPYSGFARLFFESVP